MEHRGSLKERYNCILPLVSRVRNTFPDTGGCFFVDTNHRSSLQETQVGLLGSEP